MTENWLIYVVGLLAGFIIGVLLATALQKTTLFYLRSRRK